MDYLGIEKLSKNQIPIENRTKKKPKISIIKIKDLINPLKKVKLRKLPAKCRTMRFWIRLEMRWKKTLRSPLRVSENFLALKKYKARIFLNSCGPPNCPLPPYCEKSPRGKTGCLELAVALVGHLRFSA